jgi:hypothetical protein
MRRGRALGALAAVAALGAFATPPAIASSLPGAAACPMFPADSWWHSDISALPVHPQSASFVASMGAGGHVHADFGAGMWDGGPIGIPFVVVGSDQPAVPVSFEYDDESDPGPYRVPANPPIEGGPNSGGDRHILIVDRDSCQLAELYAAYPAAGGGWTAGSGATWDLRSNALRPDTWTSADAAGLPILPGLVRRDEVAAGHIDHAIRITASTTARSHIWPARHDAGSSSGVVPMGLRLRLKAGYDISGFPADDQVILQAMKTYGVVVADNGSSWYISGAPDPGWDDDVLHTLGQVAGSAFEAVDTSSLMVDPSSGVYAGATTPTDGIEPVATRAPGDPTAQGDTGGAFGATGPAAAPAEGAAPDTTAVPDTTVTARASTAPPTTAAGTAAAPTVTRPPDGGNGWWGALAGLAIAGVGATGAWVRLRARPVRTS